jgi:hypothetical protein
VLKSCTDRAPRLRLACSFYGLVASRHGPSLDAAIVSSFSSIVQWFWGGAGVGLGKLCILKTLYQACIVIFRFGPIVQNSS